jgi:outer membrane receptor protein involved in Fe transport
MSVQGEFRSEESSAGDVFVNFDPTDFSANRAVRQDTQTVRLGFRHAFSRRSQLIGSFYWQSQDFSFTETSSLGDLVARERTLRDTRGITAELRHVFRAGRFGLNSGIGRFQSERERDETIEFEPPLPGQDPPASQPITDNPEQTNAYVYSLVDLPHHVTVTLGASADFFERETLERNQFNPKFGITWQPIPSTTLRASALRTLNRSAVSSQTIEPTQVAGFSQLYADGEAEEAQQYGVAVDHKFSRVLFGGASYTRRNLSVPVEFPDAGVTTIRWFPRVDNFGRAYLYVAPDDRLSLQVEYFVEDFDRREFPGDEGFLDVRTHRVALGAGYFHPSGAIAQLKAVHVNQCGEFLIRVFPSEGDTSFWVVDAAVGYRLPKRFGRLMVEVRNLFDETFRFQDTDPANPVIRTGRLAAVKFVLGV